MAIEGRARLSKKRDELTEELQQLEEKRDEVKSNNNDDTPYIGLTSEGINQDFYDSTINKMRNFVGHLQKRNRAQRKATL